MCGVSKQDSQFCSLAWMQYFDNQPGIKKHCDDADGASCGHCGVFVRCNYACIHTVTRRGVVVTPVNINFWVTPDEANLDPETGGLVVYKAQPPSHWTFDDFQMMPQSQVCDCRWCIMSVRQARLQAISPTSLARSIWKPCSAKATPAMCASHTAPTVL